MENNLPNTGQPTSMEKAAKASVSSNESAPKQVVKKRLTNKIKMTLGLIGTLFILLGVTYLTFTNVNKLQANSSITRHTIEALEVIEEVLANLSDSETGQRGYLLTGELKYLEPYNSGVSNVDNKIAELKNLTNDNPNQQERIITLEQLVDAKKAELAETVDLKAQDRGEEAIVIVLSDKGKDIMDNIRVVIDEMKNEEQNLLVERQAELEVTQDTTKTILLYGSLVGVFFVLFVSFFIVKSSDPNEST